MIYWVAAVEKPKRKKDKDGKEIDNDQKERLLLSPTAIIAKSEQSAAFIVARMKELGDADPDRTEILVRPF